MEEVKFFDFKSNENFNLDEEYKSLFKDDVKVVSTLDSKIKDAEDIIYEFGSVYIEKDSLDKYEKSYLNMSEFLKKFNTESNEVKSMTKDGRDKIFGYGKEMFRHYEKLYRSLNFNFELSVKEWNYIDNILNKKMLYNGNELFNYWELYTKFIEPTKKQVGELPKNSVSFVATCSIQSLILLSHLLMKNEEKASDSGFRHFRNVLTEIAKMTKLFNAYGVMLERMTNSFNNWVNALNAMDEVSFNSVPFNEVQVSNE